MNKNIQTLIIEWTSSYANYCMDQDQPADLSFVEYLSQIFMTPSDSEHKKEVAKLLRWLMEGTL